MNAQEFNGVARQIERLTKRVVVAEERGKQQEAALALIAIHMGQDRDAFDSMDLVAHIKASQARSADLAASYKREIGALKAERDDLRQIVEMVHADLRIKLGDHIGQAIGALKKEVEIITERRNELRDALQANYEEANETKKRLDDILTIRDGETIFGAARRVIVERNEATTEVERFKKEVERLRSEVEPLRQESARNEAAAWNAKKGVEHLRSEVESLRAKLASRTVEWPEWADIGARVRVRSVCGSQTKAHQFKVGEEFRIGAVDDDWTVRKQDTSDWAHIGDLEPVAENVAPPSPQVGDTVRLVRTPKTFAGAHYWCNEWGQAGDHGKVLTYKNTDEVLVSCKAGADRAYWPVSCVEVVK